jgi:hypothetical protein
MFTATSPALVANQSPMSFNNYGQSIHCLDTTLSLPISQLEAAKRNAQNASARNSSDSPVTQGFSFALYPITKPQGKRSFAHLQ